MFALILFRDPARSVTATGPIPYRLQHQRPLQDTSTPLDQASLVYPREQAATSSKQEIGFGRSPVKAPPWSIFGGCDQSLIQATARPSGRDSTWFLQSWFSLDPTTRHYPFSEIALDTGCGRLSLSLTLLPCKGFPCFRDTLATVSRAY